MSTSGFSLNRLFQSGMCLQQGTPLTLWGTCEGIDYVAVHLLGQVYLGTIADGRWEVTIPSQAAGGPYTLLIDGDKQTITLHDVYFGEVFLLSGQSNMEWKTAWLGDVLKPFYQDEKASLCEELRMLTLPTNHAEAPLDEIAPGASWTRADSRTIPEFSAIGYIFAQHLQKALRCPVGVICNAVGGSILEYWLSREQFEALPKSYRPILTPGEPVLSPSLGYNGLVSPLLGWRFRGVLWYQGESNTGGNEQDYHIALSHYVSHMRAQFNAPTLPFAFFELARFGANPLAYSIINERIGEVVRSTPHTFKVRNLDQGEWDNIHPCDKRMVAYRCAQEVLHRWFGKEQPSPVRLLGANRRSDREVELVMDKPVCLRNGSNGFEVLTANGYTYDCAASASANTVTIRADIPFSAIRYGYTASITPDIIADVSKMVTVYDEDNYPLDLFKISI